MRYICIDGLYARLPPGWVSRARRALDDVRAASPDDRASVIDNRSSIWKDLKMILSDLSDGKCWYCESREIRSDYAVDHYRPKGSVAGVPDHGGYWWLAFDWRNLRFSCTYCNSKRSDAETGAVLGKHDNFPLVQEAFRIYSETEDYSIEQPMLLDPTHRMDPQLLWFEPDGRAVPKYDFDSEEIFHKRAQISIELLHLNEFDVRTQRHELYLQLSDMVRSANSQFVIRMREAEIDQGGLDEALRLILRATDPKAAHSSAARAMLSVYRTEYPWIDPFLTNDD